MTVALQLWVVLHILSGGGQACGVSSGGFYEKVKEDAEKVTHP